MKLYRWTARKGKGERGIFQVPASVRDGTAIVDWLVCPHNTMCNALKKGFATQSWFTPKGHRKFKAEHQSFMAKGEKAHIQIKQWCPTPSSLLARSASLPFIPPITNLKPGDIVYFDEYQVLFCIPKEEQQ